MTSGYRFEEIIETTFPLTVFGIGTAGIEVAGHIVATGIRKVRTVVCHADKSQLWASRVEAKLLYEPDSDQDILADLRQMLSTSALTILAVDLTQKESRDITLKAAQILDEQDACYIVALAKPDGSDRVVSETLTRLQQHSNGLLVCRPEMIGPISTLALAVQDVCTFCDVLTIYDLPDIREILPSSGRIMVVTASGNGTDRVNEAFRRITKQLTDRNYDYRKVSRMLLLTHFPDQSWVDSTDRTMLIEKSKRLLEKDPEVFKHGSIIDSKLSSEIGVELLLWSPE